MVRQFRFLHVSTWLHPHAPRTHVHATRALMAVFVVVGLSLLASALQVTEAAVSGALLDWRVQHAVPSTSAASSVLDGGAAMDASLVELPSASVDAISL